jgi:hypothetical protein
MCRLRGYLDASLEFNPVLPADLFLSEGYETAGSTNVQVTVTSSDRDRDRG